MTLNEIEQALTTPSMFAALYSGLTPSQASDLYNWGFVNGRWYRG